MSEVFMPEKFVWSKPVSKDELLAAVVAIDGCSGAQRAIKTSPYKTAREIWETSVKPDWLYWLLCNAPGLFGARDRVAAKSMERMRAVRAISCRRLASEERSNWWYLYYQRYDWEACVGDGPQKANEWTWQLLDLYAEWPAVEQYIRSVARGA